MNDIDNTPWSFPEADDHGFAPLEVIRAKAARGTRERFLEDFPAPALLSVFAGSEPGSEALDPNDSGVQLMTVSIKSRAILRYLGKLAFVTKRPGNLYAHLISIGRSKSNDITVAVDSVSKVHGYFVRDGDSWSFTDHNSTNGSKIGGEELTARDKYPLQDGAVLQLGLEVILEYLSPEALYRKVAQR